MKEGTFQTPLVSWLYERGWRQGFNANGFPGIDEEFRQVRLAIGSGWDLVFSVGAVRALLVLPSRLQAL